MHIWAVSLRKLIKKKIEPMKKQFYVPKCSVMGLIMARAAREITANNRLTTFIDVAQRSRARRHPKTRKKGYEENFPYYGPMPVVHKFNVRVSRTFNTEGLR